MTRALGIRRPDFREVRPTAEEKAAWYDKHPRQRPPYRAECRRCGRRIWYSGIGVVSHVQACPRTFKLATEEEQ
jgi:hypothetical protein